MRRTARAEVMARESVRDGIEHEPLAFKPGAGRPVQSGDEIRVLVEQALVQDIGEELVVAIPAANIIQRIQEQICALEALQDFLAVATARDRFTQRGAHPIKD